VHVLEIPKFELKPEELETPLARWMYFLKHGAELDPDQLPPTLRTPEMERALEVMQAMTRNGQERQRYEARLKAQRDHYMLFTEGRREAWQEGLTEGLVRQIRSFERLLHRPVTPTDQLVSQPLADLERLVQELETAMEDRGSSQV
jgi:hypothetical protein